MSLYSVPNAENAVHVECILDQVRIDSNLMNKISKYIQGTPTTYFIGIDDDSICQIKTSSLDDSHIVYKILSENLEERRVWLIQDGKVLMSNYS